MADIDLIPTHVSRVVRRERIAERFVRVTFGGLDGFRPIGPDDFAYVLLPPPGRDELTIDESFRWSAFYAMDEAERPVGAYYSVRAFRPFTGELDCDVFLHEPAGHVSAWAVRCRPGDPAALWGPRTAWTPPPDTRRWVLAVDETGIPAMAAVLEHRPAGVEVVAALVECDRAADVPAELLDAGAVPVVRGALVEAVRELAIPVEGTYAWGGAESRAMRDVRRHLRKDVGLAREQVSMTPYWRHADHAQDPVDDDD